METGEETGERGGGEELQARHLGFSEWPQQTKHVLKVVPECVYIDLKMGGGLWCWNLFCLF